ncbi:MAG: SpoIIE family protein phosphatase [Chloroflexota bacterium]
MSDYGSLMSAREAASPTVVNFLNAWRAATGVELYFDPPSSPPQREYSFQLGHADAPLGYLSLDSLPTGMPPSQAQAFLQMCGDLLAAAFNERQAADRLSVEVMEAWNRLTFVYRLNEVISRPERSAVMLESVAAIARETFEVETAFIAQRNAHSDHSYSTHGTVSDEGATHFLNTLITPAAVVEATLANSSDECLSLFAERSAPPMRSFLGMTLPTRIAPPSIIGLINHISHEGFSPNDRVLLENAAEQTAALLDNIVLNERRTANTRLLREVEIASFLQSSLLPSKFPKLDRYEFAAINLPAASMSGDFYDVIEAENGDVGFAVIDIAGKGIPAAMLTTMIRTTIRSEFRNTHNAARVLSMTNRELYDDMSRVESFATAFFAVLMPKAGQVHYVGAGHTSTLWWQSSSRSAVPLPSVALPLGIFEELEARQQSITLNAGDVLVIYSDGVTESENAEGKVFGEQGLADVLYATHSAPADKILQAILDSASLHRGSQPLGDDLTVLIIKASDSEKASVSRAFVLPAALSSIQRIESILGSTLGALATDPRYGTWRDELHLGIVELMTNIVKHAYDHDPSFRIHALFSLYTDRFTIDMIDSGESFEGEIKQMADIDPLNPPEGGLGIHIISAVMDVVDYKRIEPSRNQWHLEKKMNNEQ